MLAGCERSQHQLTMVRNPGGDRHEVDAGRPDQVDAAAIGSRNAKGPGGRIRRLPAVRGDRGELQTIERLDRRNVPVPRPAAFSARTDDPDPYCHAVILLATAARSVCTLRSAGLANQMV